jgi:hypothetical protein
VGLAHPPATTAALGIIAGAAVALVLVALVWSVSPMLDVLATPAMSAARPQQRVEGVQHLDIEPGQLLGAEERFDVILVLRLVATHGLGVDVDNAEVLGD